MFCFLDVGDVFKKWTLRFQLYKYLYRGAGFVHVDDLC